MSRKVVRDEENAHRSADLVVGPFCVLDATSQLTEFGALRGNLFAEQSCREEHAAEDQARLHDSPRGPGSDSSEHEAHHGDNTRDNTDGKQTRAKHTEQEEWLLRKPELEPHGEHVEDADGNA